jgi:glycosyltransferase involved in cell wall biosynthesis
MKVLAIVPAYNEEESVAEVVQEILARGDTDVVVIDDGSDDDTAAIAESAGARVVRLPFNLGIGGAVQTGYRFARDHGYDVAIQVDGDGQHRADQIDHLLEAVPRADLVLGSRYVRKSDYHAPLSRRAGMIVFSWVVSAMTGQRFQDTTSGFRAAGRRVIEFCAEHYPRDYPEVEALLLLRRAGFRIEETACEFRERAGGQSSITASRSAYYMVKVLLALFVGQFRRVPDPETLEDR